MYLHWHRDKELIWNRSTFSLNFQAERRVEAPFKMPTHRLGNGPGDFRYSTSRRNCLALLSLQKFGRHMENHQTSALVLLDTAFSDKN